MVVDVRCTACDWYLVKSYISNNPVFTKHYTRSITNVCVVHWNTDNDNDLITEVTHNIRERIKLQLEV